MIRQEAMRVLRITTATVRQWLMFLFTGCYALGLLAAAYGKPNPAGPPIALAAALFCSFIWLFVGAGCTSMAIGTWKLRIPGAWRSIIKTLLLTSLLTIALPTAIAATHGESVVWSFLITLCLACCVMASTIVPGQGAALIPAVWLLATLGRHSNVSMFSAFAPSNPHAPYWLLLIICTAITIYCYEWRSMITGKHSMLGMGPRGYEGIRNNWKGSPLQEPIVENAKTPWLSPRASRIKSGPARIRILLGRTFAPGGWQRQFLFMSTVVIAIGWVLYSLQSTRTPLPRVLQQTLPVIAIVICLLFPQQLNLAFRRYSHDLQEMALLPGLTPPNQQLKYLIAAALLPPTLFITAIMVLVSMGTLAITGQIGTTLVSLLVIFPISWLLSTCRILRTLAKGSAIQGYATLDGFIWALVAGASLLPIRILTNAITTSADSSSTSVMLVLILFIAPLLVLGWHWYRQAAALPHPFLDRG